MGNALDSAHRGRPLCCTARVCPCVVCVVYRRRWWCGWEAEVGIRSVLFTTQLSRPTLQTTTQDWRQLHLFHQGDDTRVVSSGIMFTLQPFDLLWTCSMTVCRIKRLTWPDVVLYEKFYNKSTHKSTGWSLSFSQWADEDWRAVLNERHDVRRQHHLVTYCPKMTLTACRMLIECSLYM